MPNAARTSQLDSEISTTTKQALQEVISMIRARRASDDELTRGKKSDSGAVVLLAGFDGRGKSKAAQILAGETERKVSRVNLAKVVSRYIGETEKNLRKLFDSAEVGGTILFFDEAEALFGKRSEVKDAHDRHTNLEVSFRLQLLETYKGLAILAVSSKEKLDDALLRRIRFIIDFPHPGKQDEEKKIQSRATDRSQRKLD